MRNVCGLLLLAAAACGPLPVRTDGGAGGGGLLLTGGGFGGVGGGFSTAGGSTAGGSTAGGAAGGSSAGGGTSSCGAPGTLSFTQLHGTFAATSVSGGFFPGGLDVTTRRAFAFPHSTSATLQKLATVRFDDAGTALPDGGSRAYVEWLPVTGSVPTGNLTASAFDEQSNVLTGLYLAKNPLRYEVVTLQISNTEARFTTLSQTDTPDANGFLISRMEGTSSSLGVQVGNDLRTLSIAGTQATWGPSTPAQVFSELSAYDRSQNRVISIGSFTFVPPNTLSWSSTVQERPATAPMWTPVTFSGMGLTPFAPNMAPVAFVAYDSADDRLVVAGTRPGTIAGMPVQLPTAIEASLRTRSWRDLGQISSIVARAPFFYDRAYRQVFTHDLTAYSLAPGRELQASRTVLTRRAPPQSLSYAASAVRLPDGRVLVTHDGLSTFTPSTSEWNALPARVPATQTSGAALAWDPVGSRALLVFGSSSQSAVGTNSVLALSADGATLTPVATTGALPTARTMASAVVVGTELIVVGGSSGTTDFGDVFALDLGTLVWRRVGQVQARQRPSLLAGPGSVLVVAGRSGAVAFVPTVERVDLSTGAVQALTVTGPLATSGVVSLAPFHGGLAGFDIGDTFDLRPNAFLELAVSGNTASWTSTDPQVMDQALAPVVAVEGSSCNEALFVGPSSFRVTR